MKQEASPPKLAVWLLGRLFPAEEREFGLGDLEEGYAKRCGEAGPWAANRWCWAQVFRSVGPLLTFENSGWEVDVLKGMSRDLRGGLRQFRRNPLFAGVVVATVAIGVGAATAVFSVLNGVILTPLSFPESQRVVTLWGQLPDYPRAPLTVGDHNELVHNVEAFDEVSAEWGNTALILGDGNAEQVAVGWVTPNYFRVLGTLPHVGRLLDSDDSNAVVLDHALWMRRYGADPGVVGQVIDLDGTPMEVLGVLRPGENPNLTSFSGRRAANEIWRLQPPEWTQGDDRSVGWLRSSARLAPGVSVEQAQAEVAAMIARVNTTVTDRDGGQDLRINVKPVRADLVGGIAPTLWVLFAAVGGVLLIAATNVANLMLGRVQQRSPEVAVRAALGGSRVRLFRQFFVESLMLAAAGGLFGIGVAWAGMKVLTANAPATLPRLDTIALDPRVLGFALVATTLTAVLFGLIPALRTARPDLAGAVGLRSVTAGRKEQRLSRALVISEIALSLALLVGTGLLLRSLKSLDETELGFDKQGVITFALETPHLGETDAEAAGILGDYIDRVRQVPGAIAVGVTNRVPLAGGLFTGGFRSEEMIAAGAEVANGSYRFVTPHYFQAIGAQLLLGRSLEVGDGIQLAVIDQNVADQLWPGEDPLGRRIEHSVIGSDPVLAEVVGVVGPMKHGGVDEASPPTVFLPMLAVARQQNSRYMVVRVAGDPLSTVEGIRHALRQVDTDAVMARIRPISTLYAASVASTRFAGQLLGAFSAVALLLAMVGLHGVIALAIRRRSREFGIRVAIGAQHRAILTSELTSGMRIVVLGVGGGLLLSLGLTRFLNSLLYGVGTFDTATLLTASAVILAVGLMATYLPTRRVLSVDPVSALRSD